MKKNSVIFIGALLALSLVSCEVHSPVETTAAETAGIVTVFTETEEITVTETGETADATEETTAQTTFEITEITAAQTTADTTEDTPSITTEVVTSSATAVPEPEVFSYEKSDLSGYIMLGKYLGIEVNVESLPALSDDQVEIELELFMESIAYDAAVLEGECKYGDKVNIDYYGTIDGQPFYGSDGEGYSLTLGNHEYIVDVDDGIVGMTVGETREVTAIFPDDYGNAFYNGKTAVFEITLNYIYPALTDELVAEYTDCKTVAEFKKSIQNATLADYRESLRDVAIDKAMANSYFIGLPKEKVNEAFESILSINRQLADMSDVPYEEYLLDTYGITGAEADEIFMNSAKNEVAQRVLVYAIARDMGMDVSRKACEKDILGAVGYEDMEKFISDMGIDEKSLDSLCYNIIREKVISKIVSQAEFVKYK